MKLTTVIEPLKATIQVDTKDLENREFDDIIACDLMSDVLVVEEEDFILVTSLTSDQVARTADIVGATGIILVNGKTPQPNLKALAQESELPMLSTPFSCFDTCCILGKLKEGE